MTSTTTKIKTKINFVRFMKLRLSLSMSSKFGLISMHPTKHIAFKCSSVNVFRYSDFTNFISENVRSQIFEVILERDNYSYIKNYY